MKIGFDAKRAMLNYTGLGNYSRFVIKSLHNEFPDNDYALYCPKLGDSKFVNELKGATVKLITKHGLKPFWRTFGVVKDIVKDDLNIYHGLSNELPYGIEKTRTKSVLTMHDLIFLKYPQYYPPLERYIYDKKAQYACNVADRIIAVSECTKRDIVAHYKINPDKISVIYQGCSSVFSNIADKQTIKQVQEKYNLPANYILSIGSIEDRKNILLVVKALKYLPDVHFVAIGKKRAYGEKVEKYARENGFADRFHIINSMSQEDMPIVLQGADLFIYPSLYEGFGIPIIEAMNSRVPVIGATGSCLEEAGGPHSIYVNPFDDKELADEIRRVLADSQLRKMMIEEGVKYVAQFSSVNCANQTMNEYISLLK